MTRWTKTLSRALVSGTVASATSSGALALLARAEGRDALQPVNATSHWRHGERATAVTRADLTHTGVGYATHHAATVFWAVLFEWWIGERRALRVLPTLRDALAVSAVAAVIDYTVTPKRFTPGWEFVLSKRSMALAYVAMGVGWRRAPWAWVPGGGLDGVWRFAVPGFGCLSTRGTCFERGRGGMRRAFHPTRTAASTLRQVIVVSIRIGLVATAILSSCLPGQAGAASYAAYCNCNDAYVKTMGLETENSRWLMAWPHSCHSEVCRAERDVQCVIDAVQRRNRPGTMGFPTRREADVAADAYMARIWAFGREHPSRIPLYCAALVKLSQRAVRNLANVVNQGTLEDMTELGARLDRPGQSCSARILALVPRTSQAARLIDEFRGYCWATRSVCDRIRLPTVSEDSHAQPVLP